MKRITKTIPAVLAFRLDLDNPEEMNELYPFMHNLASSSPRWTVTLDNGKKILLIPGTSFHMEPPEHAIQYAGLAGREWLAAHLDEVDSLSRIILLNFCWGPVENVDPEDGMLSVTWPEKNLLYKDKTGVIQHHNVELISVYVDMDVAAASESGPFRDFSAFATTGNWENVKDPEMRRWFESDMADGLLDDEPDDSRTKVWEELKQRFDSQE